MIANNKGHIVAISTYRYKLKWIFFDKKTKEHVNFLKLKMGTDNISIVDSKENYWVAKIWPSNKSTFYVLYDLENKKIKKLFKTNIELSRYIFKKEEIKLIKASDGLEIPCLITYPNKIPAPTILLIHGGPQSADNNQFNRQVQFFSQLGFATVRVNFRGSVIGKDFQRKGYEEYGGKIIDDINDVAKFLVKTGFAKKKCLGIFGHSFGGICYFNGYYKRTQIV